MFEIFRIPVKPVKPEKNSVFTNHQQFEFKSLYDKDIANQITEDILNKIKDILSVYKNDRIVIYETIPSAQTQFITSPNTISILSCKTFKDLDILFPKNVFDDIFDKYKDHEYILRHFSFNEKQISSLTNILDRIDSKQIYRHTVDDYIEISVFARNNEYRKELFDLMMLGNVI